MGDHCVDAIVLVYYICSVTMRQAFCRGGDVVVNLRDHLKSERKISIQTEILTENQTNFRVEYVSPVLTQHTESAPNSELGVESYSVLNPARLSGCYLLNRKISPMCNQCQATKALE